VRAGDEISQYYDPMIAKLVVWGEDRKGALRRLRRALASYHVAGVTTNISFLQRVVAHPAFAEARLDTGLISRHHAELFAPPQPPSPRVLAVTAIGEFLRLSDEAARKAQASDDRFSPWHAIDPWWLNSGEHAISLSYSALGLAHAVRLRAIGGDLLVSIAGAAGAADVDLTASASRRGEGMAITLDGVQLAASVVPLGDQRYVYVDGQLHKLMLVDPMEHASEDEHRGGHLTAPMSGTIVAVLVKAGDSVARGAPLLILEAMKMEHTITAPDAGTVSAVHYRQGDQVSEGVDLIDVDASDADTGEAKPTAV
jgi:3-methylcrotonyl-CoA carboxylase alpha subunit